MKNKKLLAIILLSLSFCFLSGAGYGEVQEWMIKGKAGKLEFELLHVKVSYVMFYPDTFLRISYYYDETGWIAENFPAGVSTKDKIVVSVIDNRDVFFWKIGSKVVT